MRPVIAACDFHDLGGGGVRVESEELVVHDTAVGTESKLVRPEPIAATIIGCQIRDIGHRYPSCVVIYLGNSGFHRVLHNHLQDIPYTGISSGWIWGYKPSRKFAVRIEHNRIHHINHRLLLSDNGAIYTLGRHPGGRIHGNWISDVGCYGYGGWGIYPDEGSSAAISSPASLDAHVKLSLSEEHRSLTFTGNVITAADGSWDSALVLPTEQLLWPRNTVFDPRLAPLDAKRLVDLQAQGQHRGPAIADPLVRDAAGGDPTPRSDSPVKGLVALVQRAVRAGVRPQRSLPARFADYDLPSDEYYPIIETELTKVGDPLRHPDGSHQVRFRAVWRNPGRVKAHAEASLQALGTCTLNGQTQVANTLAPGAEVVREVVMEVPAGVPQATLRSVPKAGPAVEHQIFVRVAVAGRKVTLPQLGARSAVDQVPALLASRPWEETRFGILGSVCAQLRFALVGQHLALHVIVPDVRMDHGVQPSTGSYIEVYTRACRRWPQMRSAGHPAEPALSTGPDPGCGRFDDALRGPGVGPPDSRWVRAGDDDPVVAIRAGARLHVLPDGNRHHRRSCQRCPGRAVGTVECRRSLDPRRSHGRHRDQRVTAGRGSGIPGCGIDCGA